MSKKNKILRFSQLLKENYDMDDQFINDLTNELKDDFIKFDIIKGFFSEQSYEDGISGDAGESLFKSPTNDDSRICYAITIDLKDKLDIIGMSSQSPMIHGNKIYKIFSHLNKIADQSDDSYIKIRTIGPNHNPYHIIVLYLLSDENIDMEGSELSNIYYQIKDKFLSQHSDFANNSVVIREGESIIITISTEYTDRKLNMILKGIDLSNYNVNRDVHIAKLPSGSTYREFYGNKYNRDSAVITITKK